MKTINDIVYNRYFLAFFLLWLAASCGISMYEPERNLLGQLLIALFYLVQFLLIFFFVRPGLAPFRSTSLADGLSEKAPEGMAPAGNAGAGSASCPGYMVQMKNVRTDTLFLLLVYLILMTVEFTLVRSWYLEKRTGEMLALFWTGYAAIPAIYFFLRGYRLSDAGITTEQFGPFLRYSVVSCLLLLPFMLVATNSAMYMFSGNLTVGQRCFGIVFAFLYGFVTAGFFEEFFFRALLQSRLAGLVCSEAGGLFLSSILFALYHLPSRIITTNGSIGHAFAMTLSGQMLISPIYGLLWLRTRNLMIPVVVHSLMDAVYGFYQINKAYGIF